MINTWAWCGWTVTAVILISITRNPIYLILLFMIVTIVSTTLASCRDSRRGFISPLPFLGFISLTASAFNGLTSHFGSTVLFVVPGEIPLFSGAITLEALAYGAINGLVLSSLFVTFMVFNQALPTRALIRLIPRAFFPVAVVVSIAITFFPSTRRQMEMIREAQMVRGHRVRGIRDILPLVMPLLVGGLERAFQLAEAMTARGFSGPETRARSNYSRLVLLAGLALVFCGWLLGLFPVLPWVGQILILIGVALVIGVLVFVGRQSSRTTYQKDHWSKVDIGILAGSAFALSVFLIPMLASLSVGLAYNPYPTLLLPSFNPWLGMALLSLLVPAIAVYLGEP